MLEGQCTDSLDPSNPPVDGPFRDSLRMAGPDGLNSS